jgi:hypothetical protein
VRVDEVVRDNEVRVLEVLLDEKLLEVVDIVPL